MALAAYQHFCSKPKNRPPKGLSYAESEKEFNEKLQDPLAIVDYQGEWAGFTAQIGVKVLLCLIVESFIHLILFVGRMTIFMCLMRATVYFCWFVRNFTQYSHGLTHDIASCLCECP